MEQDYQEKSQVQIESISKKVKNEPITSEFLEEYQKYFEDFSPSISKQQIIFELSKKFDGKYNEINQRRPFQLKVLSHTFNYQILECKVHLMYFTMAIHIYNQKGKSKTHAFRNISTTNIGIYSTLFQKKKIVIKCLPISEVNFEENLVKSIQQFCLLKIASILKIGPSIDKIFGFDLILYQQCIQFGMEYCQPIHKWDEKHALELKKKLFSLHLIHIAHVDIKPQNIRFSPSLNEYVFIDYGLSCVVFQDLGEKTETPFMGTLGFCSSEMRRSYYEKNSFVDLYYNDIQCLQLTFQAIQQLNFNKIQKESQQDLQLNIKETFQMNMVLEQLLVIYLKSVMYLSIIDSEQHIKIFLKYHQVFKQFFKTLPFSWRNERFQLLYLLDTLDRKDFENTRPRKSIFFIMDKQNNKYALQSENENAAKVNQLIDGISLGDRTSHLDLQIEENSLKEFLMNTTLIKKIDKLQYFSFYAKFVDRCAHLSSLHQKMDVSKIMIFSQSLGDSLDGATPMEQCLLHVLNTFINCDKAIYLSLVPVILTNLFIFETLAQQQIISIYQTISGMQLDPIFHSRLLFNCFVIREWIAQRAITRYKFTFIVSKIESIIFRSLQRLIQKHNHPILLFLKKLISHDISHSQVCPIEDLCEQLQLLRQEIDEKFAIQLLLFATLIRIKSTPLVETNSSGTNFQRINFFFETICINLQKLHYERINIDYITLKLLVFCCEKNISEAALNYYAKIEKHLESTQLMSKFKFHYTVKFNSYCNFLLSFDEIQLCFLEHIQSDCYFHDEQIMLKFIKLINHSWFHFIITFKGNEEHLSDFQKAFSIQRFTSIRLPTEQSCSNYQHNLCKYYRLNFLFIVATEYFSNRPDRIAQGRKQFIIQKGFMKKVDCLHCLANCQRYSELLDAHLLYGEKKFVSSVEKCMTILQKMLESKTRNIAEIIDIQETAFKIIKITYNCNLIEKYQYDCWWKITNWMKQHGLYWITIAPHFQEEYFNFMCIFSLVIEQNPYQFFCFSIKLIEFLSHFHSTPILTFFNHILIKFCHNHPSQMQMFNDQALSTMLKMIPENHFQLKYLNLLFSACLRLEKRQGIFNKTLKFICQKIKLVHHSAKKMILGNVYYYQLRSISSDWDLATSAKIQKRQKAKMFKLYIKEDIFRLSFREFLSAFLIRPLKRKKHRMENLMKAKIGKYYTNIGQENQMLIYRLAHNYLYQNPFLEDNRVLNEHNE